MSIASRQKRTHKAAPGIFFLAKVAAVIYALYLLNCMTAEFKYVSAKLDKVETMAADMSRLSARLSAIDKTNAGIGRMEKYMSYMPLMADTGRKALDQSREMNLKIDMTNSRLIATNTCMINTAGRLMDVSSGLNGVGDEMRHMRSSVDRMAAGLPDLSGMRRVMEQTNSELDRAAANMLSVTNGIDRVGSGLDEMQTLLKTMNTQFEVLPEMKKSLDATGTRLSTAFLAMEPISREIPKFAASLQEMNETSREMNRTTQEMAASLKRTHRQGVLGMAILTATGLAH
jgi:DNA repair ATPase RecN